MNSVNTTIKRLVGSSALGLVLMLVGSATANAQYNGGYSNGGYYGRDESSHQQKDERRALERQHRIQQQQHGNDRDLRIRQSADHRSIQQHQRGGYNNGGYNSNRRSVGGGLLNIILGRGNHNRRGH